ncbi:MAG TPA: Gfo/Idh/MocA family oxidoreductase, partial [Armatimonadota bacterium]|nr:Gfo/Idh/MocA family oxidoreductase [Armatimonadota bacterium]
MSQTTGKGQMGRRQFLAKTASAVTAAITVVRPSAVRGADANGRLELGIIGTGGRGRWIGELFEQHGNAKVVAVHDYFQDRVDGARERFGLEAGRCHTGLDGYRKLLDGPVDAVAIESPPYFHTAQVQASVEAGKHVFLAKPMAVDVPGCQTILAAGEKAKGRLSFVVDFQTRNHPIFREAVRRVHMGAIGAPVLGQCFYHTGRLNPQAKPGTPEARLRNWVFDVALSGDIIVEQNIHVIDVAC